MKAAAKEYIREGKNMKRTACTISYPPEDERVLLKKYRWQKPPRIAFLQQRARSTDKMQEQSDSPVEQRGVSAVQALAEQFHRERL